MLVDPLHLARTGGAPSALIEVDPHRFAYAQYCDATSNGPTPDDVKGIIDEALNLRLLPGEGAFDVLPPATPLSVELRSRALREAYSDPTERASALLAATRVALHRYALHVAGV